MDDDALDTSEYYKDAQSFRALRKRKAKNYSAAGSGESCSKNKAIELLPVILESKSGRVLKNYNPVYIHKCLEKCMGSYKACSPLSNGNLIVNCRSVQQMTTLLNCTKLTDGVVAVDVTASPRKPIGARSVIYNVPLDIPTDDILACLAGQGVQSVRRFRYKSKDSSEMTESKSIFLQFLLLTSLVRSNLVTCCSV